MRMSVEVGQWRELFGAILCRATLEFRRDASLNLSILFWSHVPPEGEVQQMPEQGLNDDAVVALPVEGTRMKVNAQSFFPRN